MQGARASLLGISRFFAHSRLEPPLEPQTLAAAPVWRERLASGTPFTEREFEGVSCHPADFRIARDHLARHGNSMRQGGW